MLLMEYIDLYGPQAAAKIIQPLDAVNLKWTNEQLMTEIEVVRRNVVLTNYEREIYDKAIDSPLLADYEVNIIPSELIKIIDRLIAVNEDLQFQINNIKGKWDVCFKNGGFDNFKALGEAIEDAQDAH